MVVEGQINIDDEILGKRDAMGIFEAKNINMKAEKVSELLFIEVPMLF